MSAALIRRRFVPAFAAAVLSVVLLSSCTGQRDPSSWSDSIKDEFVAGCDGSAAASESDPAIAKELKANAQPTAVCRCVINKLADTMDFSEFKSANSDRRDEPASARSALTGKKYDAAYSACEATDETADTTTTSSGDATTTTAEVTTTTAP